MRRGALIAIVLLISPVHARAEESDAEVFTRVFARATDDRAPVALIVDGTNQGSIVLELRGGQPIAVGIHAILPGLSGLRRVLRERLVAVAKGGKLTLADLRAVGLDVTYDPGRLELCIGIAASERERVSHSLSPGMPAEAATAIGPSEVSGYINVYAHAGDATPAYLRTESVTNVRGWVLAAHGEVGTAGGLHRGDILLSRDDPTRALRFLAGDFGIDPGGLQLGYPMFGVGVTRNFTLQPYRVIQPTSVFHFTLDRPAQVTVLVDGTEVQTLALGAGRHDVRDLPLGAGVNDIELVVHDQDGERRIRFSTTSPYELLAPGLTQFSIGFGLPLVSDVGLREYAWHRPVVTGRRRWGMTDRLTLAASFDADLNRQVIGAGFAVATRFGNLAGDGSVSHDDTAHDGDAEGIRYEYQDTRHGAATHVFTIAAHRYSPSFRGLAVLELDGRYRGDVSVATGHRLGARLFARTQVRYQAGRGANDAYDGSITLSRTFGDLAIDALAGVREGEGESRDWRVFLSARWQLPHRGGLVQAGSRTSSRTGTSSDMSFTTLPGPPPGGLVASASVHENRQTYGTDVAISYLHDRFTASIAGAMGLERATGNSYTKTSADVGSALAFAGGRVAWSRPVTGSFVLVDRNDVIADQLVGIDPVAGTYRARADRFGPAVVSNVEPYRVATVRVEAPGLPLGMLLGPSRYALLPAYQSGTLLVVGEPGTVFLRGRLQSGDGTPIAYADAELVADRSARCWSNLYTTALEHAHDCVDETPISKELRAHSITTNRAGKFSVIGVTPGRYVVLLSDGRRVPLVVPPTAAGVYDAGTLQASSGNVR